MLMDISAALRAPGDEIPFRHRDDIPPQEILGETITFSDVLLTGFCSVPDQNLHLRGQFEAKAHTRCSYCLKEMEFPISVPFEEIFTRVTKWDPPEEPSEEGERLVYEGSKVDLSHLALTLAVLELPLRFLCGEECETFKLTQPEDEPQNACQKVPDQHPFSALQQLLTKDQEV